MVCKDIKDKLISYIYGDLPTQEKGFVEEHLLDCQACSNEYSNLKKVLGAVSKFQAKPGPSFWEDFRSGIRRKLKVEKQVVLKPVWRPVFFPRLAWAFATTAVIVIICALVLSGLNEEMILWTAADRKADAELIRLAYNDRSDIEVVNEILSEDEAFFASEL